ncbi:MAG: hypothetical protein PVH29_13370 [Candidatus Zixiibacteriota bacterium]|jgi:hypothetical protein
MRVVFSVSAAILAVAFLCGCEQLKVTADEDVVEPAETVAKAPAPEPRVKTLDRAPTKEEYYKMLQDGYKPPSRTVTSGGYSYGGSSTPPKRKLSEAEGDALKVKYGEGRKYAHSGRGEDPEIPSYVDHDDGTNPPREFKGGD